MRPVVFGLLALWQIAWSEDITCCVDEDIAAAFVWHTTYSREWPDDLPLRLEPPGLEFIGSSVGHQGRQRSVAWKGAISPQATHELAVDLLLDQEWVAMPAAMTQHVVDRGLSAIGWECPLKAISSAGARMGW